MLFVGIFELFLDVIKILFYIYLVTIGSILLVDFSNWLTKMMANMVSRNTYFLYGIHMFFVLYIIHFFKMVLNISNDVTLAVVLLILGPIVAKRSDFFYPFVGSFSPKLMGRRL